MSLTGGALQDSPGASSGGVLGWQGARTARSVSIWRVSCESSGSCALRIGTALKDVCLREVGMRRDAPLFFLTK